jgi:beta-galactosidase
MKTASLGVCYYPEHWEREMWEEDARRMAALGLAWVRIGEFAWSRLEPSRGQYEFGWLAEAIDTLHRHGLKVVLGTPTATPPKWLVDEMPDMLPVDEHGRVRGFGSRRHYCFSHLGYRAECARIVTALAKAFGEHPGVGAWQTDNEYDCHNTTLSYSAAAREGFRAWLQAKYQSPQALNRAWGNVFWSMEYRDFSEVELPAGTVTEANPAHRMDFRRYSSDQVAEFNKVQADILRRLSPGRDIIHNFMGRTLAFDHYKVGDQLDVSSWDSYPLGFLEDRVDEDEEWKRRYMRAGDPDFQAFHHDLYRSTSAGRWWIMEQQPGPVNWAAHNPAPRDGMVRLWTWEAIAHGAEVVSYFRWRQAPFAQEQMHAGLLRPDSVEAPAHGEAAIVAAELSAARLDETRRSRAAIVFDYESAWAWEIQPQGLEFDYFNLVFETYRAMRALGISVDFVPASSPRLKGYSLVSIPGLFTWNEALLAEIRAFSGIVLAGPRSGSKTPDFSIPASLPPALAADLLDCRATRVESLPRWGALDAPGGQVKFWREYLETGERAGVLRRTDDGWPLLVGQGNLRYLAGWPDRSLFASIMEGLATEAGIAVTRLPEGLRVRRRGGRLFVFNYGEEPVPIAALFKAKDNLGGDGVLAPSGVAILELPEAAA